MSYTVSKSRFQKGLQCQKALWLAVHRRHLAPKPDEVQQWVFDQGSEVGRLAQRLFVGGVEVAEGYRDPAGALATTRRLLAEGAHVLYEPAFEHNGAFARVDVLAASADGGWHLYEVKSSSTLKPEHISDAAVQAYAVEGSGLTLKSINIVHIDTTYVYRGGEYELDRLLRIEDVTAEARESMRSVPQRLEEFRLMLAGPEPDVRIGNQCKRPYPCEFAAYCHAFLPERYPITALPRLAERTLHALLEAGITSIHDVPDDFPGLTLGQREAAAAVRAGEPTVDGRGIARALAPLVWPAYHLDFETVAPALPRWPGTRPYETVPFQYSVHVHHPDGTAEHREYLHTGDDDPRPTLAARLLADLGEIGSVVHYTPYERGVLAGLADALPELEERFADIIDRLFDLEPVIRVNTRHPEAAGRSSIKFVLPAWCPDLSYSGLGIADGQTASVRYLRVLRRETTGAEAVRVLADLAEYCGLDTYAMVRLLDEMRRLADADVASGTGEVL
jgi:hypothetical protein